MECIENEVNTTELLWEYKAKPTHELDTIINEALDMIERGAAVESEIELAKTQAQVAGQVLVERNG